jgi:hypothetical protein
MLCDDSQRLPRDFHRSGDFGRLILLMTTSAAQLPRPSRGLPIAIPMSALARTRRARYAVTHEGKFAFGISLKALKYKNLTVGRSSV